MSFFVRSCAVTLIGVLGILVATCKADSPETDAALERAAKSTGQQQYAAIDDLGERHEDAARAVPALQKLLSNKDPQVRWRAARALGDYDAQATVAAADLRKRLADSESVVQYHAAVALGRIEDRSDETVKALISLATSKDPHLARAAIASLRNLKPGPERVLDALSAALKSDDEAVTLHALEAIVEQGAQSMPLIKEALKRPETAYLACAAVEQIGPDAAPALPELVDLLGKTKHSQLVIQTLLAIASIGPGAESAAPKVVPLLDWPHEDTVPVAAAYALGSIGAKSADAALKKAEAKQDPFLKMVAAWARAKLNPNDKQLMTSAVDALTKGLGSKDAEMRTAAAKGLELLSPPPELAGPRLLAVANDPDPDVSQNVVNALAGLGESIIPRANAALEKPAMRRLAIRVLTQMGPKAAGAVPALIAAAESADAATKAEINFALAAIGPEAAPATDMLTKALGSSDASDRESALYALRKIGPGANEAIDALRRKMQSGDSFEAIAAAWALSRIDSSDPKLAAAVVDKLTKALSSDDEQIRLESVQALADMGAAAKSAHPALQKAAREDSSEAVRDTAGAVVNPRPAAGN
jgi:HEAT repeat protein